MRKSAIVAALLAASALPVLAQTMVEDTDGNGSFSIEELQVAYPDLTEEVFGQIDTDADGAVSADELAAAQSGGIIAE